ncbi:MAG: hypothetical protein Q4Q06_05770 [Bacteroidota bacterium]|nr:hypothetical protein [Bacteroidota bacterium]
MHIRFSILAFVLVVLASFCEVKAQYSQSSPYSKYGIGSTTSSPNQYISSMGGVSQAFRRNNLVNILNPASYSAIDTQSFVFDLGMSMTWSNIKTTDYSSNSFLASLNNISLAFPLTKSFKLAISLTPVSDISYSVTDTIKAQLDTEDENYMPTYAKGFDGSGGLDKVTLGLSYQPMFSKFLSQFAFGVNASYVFGNMYRSSILTFGGAEGYLNSRAERNYNISAFEFDLGMQYFQPMKNGDIFGFGATVGLPKKYSFDEEYFRYTYINENEAATLQDTVLYKKSDGKITMPYSISGGLSYERANKFFLGADVVYTKWSRFSFVEDAQGEMKDNIKLALGGEFIPNIYGTYLQKFTYRAGVNYDNGYIYINDERISKLGLSFGFSLPIKRLGTNINLSFEYGKLGTTKHDLIQENYYSIGLSITAKDRWFVKRKYR